MSVSIRWPGARRPRTHADEGLTIGLVNNMPDAALRTTERQFLDLLSAACGDHAVELRLLRVPQIPRGPAALSHLTLAYEDVDSVRHHRFDGLIVTGAEPRAAVLEDEPFWPSLARLCDWAETNTTSTIWSCLAAQVAALRTANIARRPFGWKLSGVFPAHRVADHPLLAGMPPSWPVPQTRYNDLPEAAIKEAGCTILSRLPDAGADVFVRDGRSLFVFVQGHPEYDADALLREYRRDVGRFLSGERDTYPGLLQGYFDEDAAVALEALRWRAMRSRDIDLLQRFPDCIARWRPSHSWREPAVQLYANWLDLLAQRKRAGASQGAPARDAGARRDTAVPLGAGP